MTPLDYQNTEESFLTAVGPCKSMNRNEFKRNKKLYITHLDAQKVNVPRRCWGQCSSQHFQMSPSFPRQLSYSALNDIAGSNKYSTSLMKESYFLNTASRLFRLFWETSSVWNNKYYCTWQPIMQEKPSRQCNVCEETVQNQVWNQEPDFCCEGCKNAKTLRKHFQGC